MVKYNSKEKVSEFKLNMLLIYKTYTDNIKNIDDKVNKLIKEYRSFCGTSEINDKNCKLIGEYAKISISYGMIQSGITQMYNLFEQFLKVYLNINLNYNFEKIKNILKEYNYVYEDNTYYKQVDKFRMINNAIKHGGIKKLKKEYPELINNIKENNKFGTILDNKLKISERELDECRNCLCEFIQEYIALVEDWIEFYNTKRLKNRKKF